MQEAAFEAAGIKAYYLVLEFDSPHFHKLMARASDKLLLDGFNITVPYKRVIQKYIRRISPEAKIIGAVNTVYRSDGQWAGTNTDVYGFLTSLVKDGKFNPKKKTALILGSGGSARAVVYGLAKSGARQIRIAARRPSRARKIVSDFKKVFRKTEFNVFSLNRNDLKKGLTNADLVVNTTSVGLRPGDKSLIPVSMIPSAGRAKRILFFDLVYHWPQGTAFLKNARRKGQPALGGLGMLLHQGAKAFERWTGKPAPVSVMKKVLEESLKKRKAK